jgi:RimJ/RimL family protein N-acetyltransferase
VYLARLGAVVKDWSGATRPDRATLSGHWVQLEPMDADLHAADLFETFAGDDGLWDFMPYGPFSSTALYYRWAKDSASGDDPLFYVIRSQVSGHVLGVAAFLNINPVHGSVEVGHICFSKKLKQNTAATEAMYLMMAWAFGAGYRRYEWKCNALNIPSRRAAQRLGFSFEGIFRNHLIVKGRNRDTAWFSIIDTEWPALQSAFAAWFNARNFDTDGCQIERLSDLTRLVRATADPAL